MEFLIQSFIRLLTTKFCDLKMIKSKLMVGKSCVFFAEKSMKLEFFCEMKEILFRKKSSELRDN